MLNFKAQAHFADVIALIQRAQLRASSDALAASLQGWSMWVQMLTPRPGLDEEPTLAPSAWPSAWPWRMPWSMPWVMSWPSPGPWQGESCNAPRFGLFLLAPMGWTAADRGLRAPSAGGSPGWLSQSTQVPAPHAAAGPGFSPGVGRSLDALDASFARYRSAGGHALAQVIVPPTEEVAKATARVWLTPLEAMFDLWRTALGVSLRPHCADAPARR
jgi:hypothetical protein